VDNKDGTITPLMSAAIAGHESVCRLLIDHKASVNTTMKGTEWTPLMFAAHNGYLSVVQVLLTNGSDSNAVNALGMMALDIAVSAGHTSVDDYLSKHSDTSLSTARRLIERMDIFEATKSGDYDQVQKLVIIDKINVNQKDEDGATPLMFAAMRGQLAIAELLVDNKAQVDFQDEKSGWTALMQATYYGHKSIVRLLIDSDTNVSIQAANGCTAFDIASIIGDTEVVRLLAAVSMRGTIVKRRSIDVGGDSPKSSPPASPRLPKSSPRASPKNSPRLRSKRPKSTLRSKTSTNNFLSVSRNPDETLRPDRGPSVVAALSGDETLRPLSGDETLRPPPIIVAQPKKKSRGWYDWWHRISSRFKRLRKLNVARVAVAELNKPTTNPETVEVPEVDQDATVQPVSLPPKPESEDTESIASTESKQSAAVSLTDSLRVTVPLKETPKPPPWRSNGGLVGSLKKRRESNESGPKVAIDVTTKSDALSSTGGSLTRTNMGGMGLAPMNKLPADIMAPIKPPFMPPPAFELSHIERPKFERPIKGALPEVSAPSMASATSKFDKLSQRSARRFERPFDRQSWALPRKSIPRAGRLGSGSGQGSLTGSAPSALTDSARKLPRKRKTTRVSFVTSPPAEATDDEPSESGYTSVNSTASEASDVEEKAQDTTLEGALQKHGLSGVYATFRDEGIDLEVFLTMSNDDIADVGIEDASTRGRLCAMIEELKDKKKRPNKVGKAVLQFRRQSGSLPPSTKMMKRQTSVSSTLSEDLPELVPRPGHGGLPIVREAVGGQHKSTESRA